MRPDTWQLFWAHEFDKLYLGCLTFLPKRKRSGLHLGVDWMLDFRVHRLHEYLSIILCLSWKDLNPSKKDGLCKLHPFAFILFDPRHRKGLDQRNARQQRIHYPAATFETTPADILVQNSNNFYYKLPWVKLWWRHEQTFMRQQWRGVLNEIHSSRQLTISTGYSSHQLIWFKLS